MKKLIFVGMKRREKEIRYVSLVTFFAVVFMTGITLLQDVMDNYLYETNLNTYGNWIISTVDEKLQHPYFLLESHVKVGANITDKDGVPMQLWVGSVDETFDLVDGEIFYEGRMPQNEFEIAMDSSSLSLLGYTYDVGQDITFSYWEADGTLCTKTYELVGVTKSIAQIWRVKFDYPIPNIFVTETELKMTQSLSEKEMEDVEITAETNYPIFQRNPNGYTVTFYQLNPEYKSIDTTAFANSFEAESDTWYFNTFVYENGVWDSEEIFQMVSCSFMIVSALAMGYLLIAYMGKRRSVYYKYRTLGASKAQVRIIILLECIYATLPQIVLGIVTSYSITFVACSIVSMQQNMLPFYHFNLRLFVEHIAVSLGIVMLSILGAMLSVNDKSLAGNLQTIKPRQYNRIRKIALRTRFPERVIFQRKRKLKPIQTICQALFSIVICGCLLFCVFKMEKSISETQFVLKDSEFRFRENTKLYHFNVREEKWGDGMSDARFGSTMYDMYNGADESILQEVLMCSGVKLIEYGWLDDRHYFTWEGMENSSVIKWLKENGEAEPDCPVLYGVGMQFYEDVCMLQQDVEPLLELQNECMDIDWEGVKNGESVIILFYNVEDENGVEIEGIKEDALHKDDTIIIRDFENQIEVPVNVAGVLDCTEINFIEIDDIKHLYTYDTYAVLGTKELAETIAKADEKELTISFLNVRYKTTASYISLDKQLATLANKYDVSYASESEEQYIFKKQLFLDMGIYGAMFFMLLCIYVLIQRNMLMTKETYWKKQYIVLKQIGMEDVQYQRLCFIEECKNYLWLFGGFLLGYPLIYRYYIVGWTDSITGFFIDWTPEEAFDFVLQVPHWLMFSIVAMIYLFMVIRLAMNIRKSVKGGNVS